MTTKRPSISPHIEHAPALPPEPFSRCTSCNTQQKANTRNLVVCIDGTSNQFGQNNTNVVKLCAKINLESKNPEQHSYYSSGIGTRPEAVYSFSSIKRAVSERLEMAVAWNIDEIVKDAYGWLARTYQEGDQIPLCVGFSRGAYQVRVLAGMIHEVGLIRTPTDKQIGTAYAHYEAIRSKNVKRQQIAREFKDTFSRTGVGAHFVGVWDTVSSVGIIRGDIFLSCAAHACHFRHALALDERRVKFMPEYLHKMNSSTQSDEKHTFPSDSKEVWFPGSHSDAGNVSLLCMRREAAAKGLVLHPTDIVWVPDDLDFGTSNSMTGAWPVIEYIPIKHQISFSGAGEDALR
ncbi:hypothetical protein OG21DRAFT_1412961 [Imleria badia]|nr:hypothetical protein OG21DRAFT_1412961 [Imleria badia]